MDHRPGAEKRAHLHKGMEHQMGQGPRHPHRRHQRHPEQDIGQVAHRRPCQPPFEMGLLQRPAAAVQNREHHQPHHHILCPGPPQHPGPEAVIGDPHHRESPRVHHRHRMEQRRHRGRGHTGPGQPGGKRPHSCLHTEPPEAQHIDQQQRILFFLDMGHVQHPARHKGGGGAVDQHEYHADERKGRAPQHIVQIAPAGQGGLSGPGMHHQRQRHQAQHLEEEVHGQDILREGHAQGDAVGGRVEQEERFRILLPLHILKGVQLRKRPEKGHQPREHRPRPVQTQGDAQIMHKTEYRKRLIGRMK